MASEGRGTAAAMLLLSLAALVSLGMMVAAGAMSPLTGAGMPAGAVLAGATVLAHITLFALAGQALVGLMGSLKPAVVMLLLFAVAYAAGLTAAAPDGEYGAAYWDAYGAAYWDAYVGMVLGCMVPVLTHPWSSLRRTGLLLMLVAADYLCRLALPLVVSAAPALHVDTGWDASLAGMALSGLVSESARRFIADLTAFAAMLWLVRLNRVSPVFMSAGLALLIACLQGSYVLIDAGRAAMWQPLVWQPLLILLLGQVMRLPSSMAPSPARIVQPGAGLTGRSVSSDALSDSGAAAGWVIFLYAVLIVYASLFPLSGWYLPEDSLWRFLQWPQPLRISGADVVSNVLAYVPLGFLLIARMRARGLPGTSGMALTVLTGLFLSLGVESLQQFLPSRTPSMIDLLTNSIGTLMGAWAGLLLGVRSSFAARLRAARAAWCVPDPVINGGLLALLIWVLSQLSPFVPSLDFGTVKIGLSGIWNAMQQPARVSLHLTLIHGLNIAGLALLAQTLARPGRQLWLPFGMVAIATLLLKTVMVGRVLAPEALAGLVCALLLLPLLCRLSIRVIAWLAMTLIAIAFASAGLRSMEGPLHRFNWIPFIGEMERNLNGFASILGGLWPFVALGCLANFLTPAARRKNVMAAGAVAIVAVVSFLEWRQTFIPGRFGDVTTILLALIGWLIAWRWRHPLSATSLR